jgi:uncharacterized protein YfaS (alpha-2-macroglobulin family)
MAGEGVRRYIRQFWPAGLAILALGFGIGFLAAMGLGGAFAHRGGAGVGVETASDAWSLFGKPRAAGAARRGIVRPADFAVWKTRLDSSGGQPLACVEMSRDLDPAKSYADFVLVSPQPDHAPAVTVRGDELCLGGVGFAERRITLLKGLPAKGGETLAADAEVDFSLSDRPPFVGFAGDGVILPRDEADGVGIETINVSRLAVEVWRVPDRNLVRKSISAPAPTAEGEYAGDYGEDSPDDEGRVVWKGVVAVRGESGTRVTTVFPLGAVLKTMAPGGYVIKARDASGGRDLVAKTDDNNPPAQARRWVVFTDMALTAYGGSASLDVVVRSLKSARVMGEVTVALMAKDGETLASAKSDASGRASFAHALLAGEGASAARMVMAYGPGGDLAVLDLDRSPLDLSKQDVGGREGAGAAAAGGGLAGRTPTTAVDGFVYSDRGIYRPGERVRLGALVRDLGAEAVNDRKGYLLVKRPSGVEFRRYAFAGTAGGAVFADVDLPKSAPRGRWSAELHIDGLEPPAGNLGFSVEDFAPQRLAVAADGRSAVPVVGGETRAVSVTARFLYGAIGAGLQAQGEARLRVDPDPFPKYEGFAWGDAARPFDEKRVDLTPTVTDGAGHAGFAFAASNAGDTADPLVAAVTASVFEPGGRPVRQGLALNVRTRPLYLGVKVDEGQSVADRAPPVSLDIIAVDPFGRRIAAPAVAWRLIRETWTYDWFQQDGRWQWRRTSHDVAVAEGAVDVGSVSAARLTRRLGWGDYRLELNVPGGARTVRRFSAGFGSPSQDAEAPDQLRLSLGAKTYVQGDTVTVHIAGPYGGEAQVAVATDHVIDFRTLTLGPGGGVVRLKTSAAWGGGAYVMVTQIHPRDPEKTPLPRRALGVIYAPLDPGGRRLTVTIGAPSRIDSRAPVSVPLRVKGLGVGQGAYVTVAAVDEGILALTKYESPDPAKWYFGKRALTVDYRDDYGRLLDPNLGAPASVNFGGDELGGQGLTVTPIKTVALWSGVVRTGADGRVTVKLPPGDFNGELRLMVVAWTGKAVGSASQAMTVREPVVADLDLPRFLAPGDQAQATIELHNLDGRPGPYAVRTAATGGLAAAFGRTVPLAQGQRIAQRFDFAAPARTGVGQVSLQVTGPGFTTAKTYDLQTRLGWGAITRVTTAQQRPGEAYVPPVALLAGLAAGDVTLQVSYSPIQGFDPAAVALALAHYPFGCTEQLVSMATPVAYADGAAADPAGRRRLAEAVGKLLDRQSLDGAFGLWSAGDGEADAWLGAYATDFLVQAKAQGASVPDEALARALGAMRQISRPDGFASVAYRLTYGQDWTGDKDAAKAATARLRARASAYALYVLAKAGHGDLPRLRWWHDVQMKSEVSPLAMAQVGAGLAAMGDHARARSALVQAAQAIGYKAPQDWYQSPLRDLAGVIALAYEAGEPEVARGLQGRLAGAVRDPDSLNTQEEAQLTRAAHFMLRLAGPVKIDAAGVTALPAAGGAPRWGVGKLAAARFVNAGGGPIWRTVTVVGAPLAAPPAQASGVMLAKTLLTLGGAPADLDKVRQGDRVIVWLTGQSRQGRTLPLVVNDALPAGFEIDSTLSAADTEKGPYRFLGKLTPTSAQESRDDRYVAALSLGGNKPFGLAYVIRAVTPGSFFLPGANAADMYHPAIFGRTAGRRLRIAPAD